MGTYAYVAPEIVQDTDDILNQFEIESDMWALGVIIFVLLAGKHPFDADSDRKLFNKILSCDYDFVPENIWENISKECIELIRKLLEPKIEERYTPEQALNHSWFSYNETKFSKKTCW